jgi:protein MpaA
MQRGIRFISFLFLFVGSFAVGSIAGPEGDVLQRWCQEVGDAVSQLKWNVKPCAGINWKVEGASVQGRPLVFAEFGNPKAENTTLVLSTVHGDEVTPLYLALELVYWLKDREGSLQNTRVVVAPLVNPDGFFRRPRTRMNAHGVDVNRNFTTGDWSQKALNAWKKRFKSDPRRFPGNEPSSEPETRFQEVLIRRVRPAKILAVHSPLNFLDYDGPSQLTLEKFPTDYAKSCEKLKKTLKAISGGFFPGSLGNYAGRELGIPTVTLELPSTDPKKAGIYWRKFSQGIHQMIEFSMPKYESGKLDKGGLSIDHSGT